MKKEWIKMETVTKRLKNAIMDHGVRGTIYDRQGLKDLIEKNADLIFAVDYQESHLAGTIAALIKKGEIQSPERGKYVVTPKQVDTYDFFPEFSKFFIDEPEKYSHEDLNDYKKIKENVEKSIQDQLAYLKKVNLTIPLGEIDKEHLGNIVKIKELLDYLEKFQLS